MTISSREQAAQKIGYHLAQAILIALESVQTDRGTFLDVTPPEPPVRARGALLDVEELSERLGVSVQTMYSWRSRRVSYGPPAMKIGRYLRWKPEVVDAWIAEQAEH